MRGLRLRGVDVMTVPEAGLMGASDERHLREAMAQGRVIFTQDEDFLALHAAGFPHAGIVYAPQGTSIGKIVSGLLAIHQTISPADIRGRVEYL